MAGGKQLNKKSKKSLPAKMRNIGKDIKKVSEKANKKKGK